LTFNLQKKSFLRDDCRSFARHICIKQPGIKAFQDRKNFFFHHMTLFVFNKKTTSQCIFCLKKFPVSLLRQIQTCDWSQNVTNLLYSYVLVSDTMTRQLKERKLQKQGKNCHFLAIFWWFWWRYFHFNSLVAANYNKSQFYRFLWKF